MSDVNFRQIVKDRLPPLVLANEPEIIDELSLHLADLYNEAIAAGLDHEAALARAIGALPRSAPGFAREIESASRTLPGLIADRWRASDDGLAPAEGTNWTALSDL